MACRLLAMIAVLVLWAGAANFALAEVDTRKDIRLAQDHPMIRGGIVFKYYCVLCHGDRGDGMARATRLYGNLNLLISPDKYPPDYYEKIIRGGGEAVGRSNYMPAWNEELTEEQIADVLAYLQVVNDAQKRGEVVFKTNCVLCHGVRGNGKGRASVLFDPPPADLTHSDKNDMYKKMIITMGGAAMGRSKVMPIWGLQLSEQQIDDVVAYLRTILVKD